MQTKEFLIELVAKNHNIPLRKSKEIVDTLVDGLKSGAESGGLTLRGFGTFKVITRKGREYNTPLTKGKSTVLPDRTTIHFKPSGLLTKPL